MRTTARNAIAGTALLAVGLGVGLAGGWAAALPPGDAAAHPSAHEASKPGTAKLTSEPVFSGELVSYNSCDTLLAALRARGRALVGPYGFVSNTGYAGKGALDLQLGGSTTAGPALTPTASSAAGADQAALPHSDTNTQVVGVDEPDIVKTDGKVMVSLDGQQLHIVDVQQPRLRSTIALPYPGSELLLAGDQVVVLSGGSSDQNSSEGGGVPMYLQYRYPYSAGNSSTTATVVDITNPDTPRIARSFTFDASELAARVVSGTIRLVLNTAPPAATWTSAVNTTPAELARATKINQSIVDALPLDAWLPHWGTGEGQANRVSACDSVAIPTATPSASKAVGMVTVLSLDPTKAAPGAGTSVFGTATTAYAEGAHLYVSDSGYENGFSDTGLNPVPPKPTLHLLEFDITDPTQARYLASGTVTGQLHDSYALSEYQNSLRVTTTDNTDSTAGTSITVLQRQGDKLAQVGQVTGLGPSEQVYAVRYIGDRGYVVTFQQIDPLHVVDLSNPTKPVLRGTLELTGYSTLLQPLPNHQLLGIGQAVNTAGRNAICSGPLPPAASEQCGGPIESTDGLQLVLFDVTDAAHPKVLAKQVLNGAYAVDPNSPHTVTADPTKVTDGGSFVMPSTNGLLGLRVASGKITVTTGAFSKPYTVQTGRAVFAGNHVFELGDRGVTVRRSADLAQSGFVSF
jgi:hypothetical protein